jgi:hypothetical protein
MKIYVIYIHIYIYTYIHIYVYEIVGVATTKAAAARGWRAWRGLPAPYLEILFYSIHLLHHAICSIQNI